MSKNVKIFISILLILCFLASPASVLAAVFNEVQNELVTLAVEEAEDEESISYVEDGTNIETDGKIEVTIAFDLPISNVTERTIMMTLEDSTNGENTLSFDINLKGTNSYTDKKIGNVPVNISVQKINKEGKVVANGEEFYYLNTIIEGVPKNKTYNVNFEGKSFVNYKFTQVSASSNEEERTLDITNYSKRLIVADTKGTFAIGDVTGDGKIDEEDYTKLQEQIGKEEKDLETYDLNCDGKIDVIDLSYIANNMESKLENPIIQMTNPIISTAQVKVSVEDKDTIINSGTVSDLLNPKTDSGISLGTKNGEIITKDNPVAFTIDYAQSPLTAEYVKIEGTQNSVLTKMLVTVELEDGTIEEKSYPEDIMDVPEEVHALSIAEAIMLGEIDTSEGKTIVINLGAQVAIKKITIKITQVSSSTPNLAEIATVELLNNVYEDLPAPDMNIPENLQLSVSSESIIATWEHAENVTGYQVKLTDESGKSTEYGTTNNTYSFGKLTNYKTYTVEVQSVNGSWKSGYGQKQTATPMPSGLPPVPESISLKGAYQRVTIGWKNMKDTKSYILYYRKAGELNYKSISLETNSYTLTGLEENMDYQFQIAGVNEHGTGPRSSMYTCRTTDLTLPVTSNYKLINRVVPNSEVTAHIKSVNGKTGEWATVDNDYSTYWKTNSWDAGGFNYGRVAPVIEFDEEYEMDRIIVIPAEDQPYGYAYGRIIYWDVNGKESIIGEAKYSNPFTRKTSDGKTYYEAYLTEPIKVKKIQIGFALGTASGYITISEMKFYHYDSLEKDVAALYNNTGDNAGLRIELSEEMKNLSVEEAHAKVEELRERANTNDPESNDPHPRKDTILKDLEYLDKLIDDEAKLANVITVDQKVSNNYNNHLGFSYTLNDLQPLGIVARPSETGTSDDSKIVVYVGVTGGSVGDSVPLQVVFTQYHPEYSAWQSAVGGLKVGKNEISVPNIAGNRDGAEAGGAVYIKYTGTSETSTKAYKVRVSGGEKIPVLDVHSDMSEQEIKTSMKEYITELENHVANLPAEGRRNQVLNSTDIVMPSVMLSIPADKALSGLQSASNIDNKVDTLYKSYLAWEEMIGIFYKEKGLTEESRTNNTVTEKMNARPGSRINIRYTRMFTGAFMYAAGMHIGIEYDSAGGLTCGKPLNDSGWNGYFGWGISHEIGHVIDQSGYASAETTNNIYSLFAQTAKGEAKSRLELSNKYPSIYSKVTSHVDGVPGDVFTYLGMYWQLHLAYDNDTSNTTDTFYARLHTLYRTDKSVAAKMPSKDRFICYASQAADKDLTEFFELWGFKAEKAEDVAKYMSDNELQKEEKAIYYLNDEARRYRLSGKTGAGTNAGFAAEIINKDEINSNKEISFKFSVASGKTDDILGYEILRDGISVGFTNSDIFTDNLNAINNKALKYEVVAYDKLLNKVGTVSFEEIKVSYDGTVSDSVKEKFTVTSNMRNSEDLGEVTDNDNLGSVIKAIDGDKQTVFVGDTLKATTDAGSPSIEESNPYITIAFNNTLAICGIKFAGDIGKYEIYVSSDNENWTKKVKSGTSLTSDGENNKVIYFDSRGEGQLDTIECGYLKIVAKKENAEEKVTFNIAEIDVVSPAGDNIDWVISEDGEYNDGAYILDKDFTYSGDSGNAIIPKGSVVFKSTYKGYPLYNAALLKVRHDNSQNYVYAAYQGENAYQEIFMATLPNTGVLTEVTSGTCLIWMTEDMYNALWTKEDGTKGLEAYAKLELYRVDDAETSEGQRLVSDTLDYKLPKYSELKSIELVSENN